MKVYKYTQRQYAQGMVDSGSIRVGTLYQFWGEENPEVGDGREGFVENFGLIPDGRYGQTNLPYILQADLSLDENSIVDFTGSVVSSDPVLVPDAYIYCTTRTASRDKMREFKYDACVDILDIDLFAQLIANELFEAGFTEDANPVISNCAYNDRFIKMLSPDDAGYVYWMKDVRYSGQEEHRIVFFPNSGQILQPINLTIPALVKVLRMHDFHFIDDKKR